MVKISCNIESIISFLQEQKETGCEKVELIDEFRAVGWVCENPTIKFVKNKNEPHILGIDIRENK